MSNSISQDQLTIHSPHLDDWPEFLAWSKSRLSMLKELESAGNRPADSAEINGRINEALSLLLQKRHWKKAEALIEAGADVNKLAGSGTSWKSLLYSAFANQNLEAFTWLLNKGADPFHIIEARNEKMRLIKELIRFSDNFSDSTPSYPFFKAIAATTGYPDWIDYVHSAQGVARASPLYFHTLCYNGLPWIIFCLDHLGAFWSTTKMFKHDGSVKTIEYMDALQLLTREYTHHGEPQPEKRKSTVLALLEKWHPLRPDNPDATPLDSPLFFCRHPDMVDWWVSKGEDPYVKNTTGLTPFEAIFMNVARGSSGSPDTLKTLLRLVVNMPTLSFPRDALILNQLDTHYSPYLSSAEYDRASVFFWLASQPIISEAVIFSKTLIDELWSMGLRPFPHELEVFRASFPDNIESKEVQAVFLHVQYKVQQMLEEESLGSIASESRAVDAKNKASSPAVKKIEAMSPGGRRRV